MASSRVRQTRQTLSQNNQLLSGANWPQASDWLVRDEFTDTRAAGSVNGTAATPGPGTRTVVDAESKVSVGSGALAFAGGKASPAYGDPGIWYGAQTRAAGLAVLMKLTHGAGAYSSTYGFDSNTSSTVGDSGIWQNGTTSIVDNALINLGLVLLSVGSTHTYAIVLRTTGHFVFEKISGTWTLLWVGVASSAATVYPAVSNYDSLHSFDYLRAIALPAPFDTDDGLATDTKSGSVAAGTTFTHESDFLLEFTADALQSAGPILIDFRRPVAASGDNAWQIEVQATGDFSLWEVVEGVRTRRAVTFATITAGHRIVIVAEGTTIKGYSNNTLRWTYSSATNFATATDGIVKQLINSGAISDLKTWPRTLSGTAASILNKVSA